MKKEEFSSFSREQKLAFWINAYNAYTVHLIFDHYPVSSIRSIGLLPGAAFRRAFIPVLGEELTLNEIENRLRQMGEPDPFRHRVCVKELPGALVRIEFLDYDWSLNGS